MSPMDKAEKAYRNDPAFHNMVKAIEQSLENLVLTPSEVREAAMFACYRFNLIHAGPTLFPPETRHT